LGDRPKLHQERGKRPKGPRRPGAAKKPLLCAAPEEGKESVQGLVPAAGGQKKKGGRRPNVSVEGTAPGISQEKKSSGRSGRANEGGGKDGKGVPPPSEKRKKGRGRGPIFPQVGVHVKKVVLFHLRRGKRGGGARFIHKRRGRERGSTNASGEKKKEKIFFAREKWNCCGGKKKRKSGDGKRNPRWWKGSLPWGGVKFAG